MQPPAFFLNPAIKCHLFILFVEFVSKHNTNCDTEVQSKMQKYQPNGQHRNTTAYARPINRQDPRSSAFIKTFTISWHRKYNRVYENEAFKTYETDSSLTEDNDISNAHNGRVLASDTTWYGLSHFVHVVNKLNVDQVFLQKVMPGCCLNYCTVSIFFLIFRTHFTTSDFRNMRISIFS